ncbi:deoxyribonuclease [Helicobacter sp. MIT 05-5293]|uniref:endonuclease n=1 Tax=Helicobacter sp. MIT 05-5293 TaxID=1548149 RepID=UPI0009DE047C|nr:endonuclease [Helicobacter sp. MIT 05-5293]TLD81092.1 deoxyribonuclease [Helicobacter sp. MIT 05-5293]
MRFVFRLVILGALGLLLCACAGKQISPQNTPKNFAQSKAFLKKAYKEHQFTQEFYCGVEFDTDTLKIISSDRYTPRNALTKQGKPNIRAQRIEFEHIMPAHRFGGNLPCWKNGGRKACQKDKKFVQMESDIRNLLPAIGEINADRSNYAYDEPPANIAYTQYGKCLVYTDFKAKRFYPADYSKGLIARVYLYMSAHYGITLTPAEKRLMQQWDKRYPPNEYERAWLDLKDSKNK